MLLPPIAWLPSREPAPPDTQPDAAALERSLAALGVTATILDPMRRPWNPLHGRHPLLQGIDPLRALRVLLAYRGVDAVICVFEGPALVLALLRRILGFRPRLLMWDLGLTPGWRLRAQMLDVLMPRLDGILVLGSNQTGRIAARWRQHPPVHCVGHYIDTAFWRPMPPPDAQPGYVLSVGDDDGRDLALLLEVAAELDCPLVIRSSRALTLDPVRHAQVRHLRARLSFTALRDLYAGADLVVVPLRDLDTAGGITAVLEAAAMGKAMVVSRSAGIADWLRDGETCAAVPCGDAGAMAGAIRALLADPVRRARLGQGARAFAEQAAAPAVFARRLAGQLLKARG